MNYKITNDSKLKDKLFTKDELREFLYDLELDNFNDRKSLIWNDKALLQAELNILKRLSEDKYTIQELIKMFANYWGLIVKEEVSTNEWKQVFTSDL